MSRWFNHIILSTIIVSMSLLTNNVVNTHRILGIFMHKINSHFDAFYPIMNGLAENGHNVTVFSFFHKPNNLSNYHEIILNYPSESKIDRSQIQLQHTADRSENIFSYLYEMYQLKKIGERFCELALNASMIDTVMQQHKFQPFDLVVTELFITDCMLGVIANMSSVPFVGVSSCNLLNWHYDKVSQPLFPSYIPSISFGYTERMSLYQRLINWIGVIGTNMIWYYGRENENVMLRNKFGADLPDIYDIGKNVSLILVNQHYSSRIAQPIGPKVVEIGGIHIGDEKPLPQNLKKILDNASNGAIVISWGSILKSSSMPIAKQTAIVKALAKFNQTVLWKWESDSIVEKPENVFIEKWLPQRDVLCHPNVKLFWSHGGNLGTSEAAYCGVPVIITPIFGDQFGNGAALVNRNIGTILYYDSIGESSAYDAIAEMLEPSYHERAKQIAAVYRNRINSPKETALWWIEHVLATGTNDLAYSSSVNLSWFAYYSVDVVLLILSIALVFVMLLCTLVKCCYSLVTCNWRKSSKKLKKQ